MVVSTMPDIIFDADDGLLEELATELEAKMHGNLLRNEPMARHTTFRVGGPADLFLVPQDEDDLALALHLLHRAGVPAMVIGNGSNLLVADRGVRGAVIRLAPNFAHVVRDGHTVVAGAGAQLGRVVHFAAAEELSGLESTLGIPGTIGGALVMNAGTDIGSISDLVECATFLTLDGERKEKCIEQLGYGYRRSALQDGNLIVTEARLRLTPGHRDAILAKMTRLEEKRTSRQPYRAHTAGSTFKNPVDIAAGKLLDRSGCKGLRVGDAEVSPKHANFIEAHPGAAAADILALVHLMQQKVRAEFDRELHLEVEVVGDWD